jgi:hypothetical protein
MLFHIVIHSFLDLFIHRLHQLWHRWHHHEIKGNVIQYMDEYIDLIESQPEHEE